MAAAGKNSQATADSWSEYRRLVLAELERLDNAVAKLTQVSLDHEKGMLEGNNTLRSDFINKVNSVKEELIEKIRKLIEDIRSEIGGHTSSELKNLEDKIESIERKLSRTIADLRIIKGQAAVLGFISGLLVAVVAIIVQFYSR